MRDLQDKLKELIDRAGDSGKFEPFAWYCGEADCLFAVWDPDPYTRMYLNNRVTLYETRGPIVRPTGVMIGGVREMMEEPVELPDETYTLDEFIEKCMNRTDRPWKPGAFFNRVGDCIHAYWAHDEEVAQYLNNVITLHRDHKMGRIIGAQIKCISSLLKGEKPYHRMD